MAENSSYNRLAGQSIERLAALSDGVFAIAMTLLVLELKTPAKELVAREADLWRALQNMAPQLTAYLMSFLTLGIFWVGQQTQLSHLDRGNRHFTWLNLAFLFAVTIMPFSTMLLAEFIRYRLALLWYWANIVLLGGTLFATWRYARCGGLLRQDITAEASKAVERRIVVGQSLYALGAALSFIDTYASIGFLVLVQLNYAIAPTFRARKRAV